ncbi:MAG TPA: SAM-dependent methyltransferase, partial [Paenibacillaceae bacterium]|nr:SAM-dependent methyltransferase [Paenibacillaceae bacterium]
EGYIQTCCSMQRDILEDAARMLRPGGKLVYSTCTFATEEDEQQIERFLREHPEFELLTIPSYPGWVGGRLWPHRIKGEGHFLALLQKKEEVDQIEHHIEPGFLKKDKVPEEFTQFINDVLPTWNNRFQDDTYLTFHEDRVFLTSLSLPSLKGLRIARQGWLLGTLKKNRFEPSQALA